MLKSIKVRDYMTRGLITLKPDMELFEAISLLQKNRISGAPVVDENGHLIGVLSEGDCLNAIIKDIYYEEAGGRVSEYMSTEVETIGPDEDIIDIAIDFNKKRKRRFPVIEDGRLVGQISQRDILRAVLEIAQHPSHG
ncbi:MAG: CBS domain-containing protein [Pseudomonadales bacterium]|nr:CBS domain-containing protein [Pseudomonadales bacterium]MCP5214673.1 CBS domain-containing protein [Pseudomonadales bacterium]MCP5303117.1 CBS domain-containing protein [Pseudomonadales bacterium]